MGHPTLTVKLDDGTGLFPYTIPAAKVLQVEGGGLSLSRGRGDEQDAVTAGQLSLTLDNSDGRFSLGATVIASLPAIAVDMRVRVIETVGASSFNRFTGYVKSWPVDWPAVVPSFATVTISASDAQARGERRVLRSVVEEEILADSPKVYFTLGEPTGAASAVDSSGNQSDALAMTGTGTDVIFGVATGPGVDGLTAAQFAGRYLTAALTGSPTSPASAVLECYFSRTGTPGTSEVLAAMFDTSIPGVPTLEARLSIDTAGKPVFQSGVDIVNSAFAPSLPVVADGATHHMALVHNSAAGDLWCWLDGVNVATIVSGLNPCVPASVIDVGGNRTTGLGSTVTISHVAAWCDSTIRGSFAQLADHGAAGVTGFAGESGTARLTRLAGYASIPLGALDTGLTNMPAANIAGTSAWPAIQDVTDAEVGLTFIDGTGDLRFKNRNAAPAKAAPDVTFTKDYAVPGAQPTGDDQTLLNYLGVTAQGTGVEQTVRNTVSESGNGTSPGHGRYSDSKTYLVQTDQEALDRGNWLVAGHAEPTVRYGQLTLNLFKMTAVDQVTALGIEPGTWLRITSMPTQTPGGATADLMVEGIAESLGENTWTLTLNVVARSLYTAWILGNSTYSVLGSTTKLYV